MLLLLGAVAVALVASRFCRKWLSVAFVGSGRRWLSSFVVLDALVGSNLAKVIELA